MKFKIMATVATVALCCICGSACFAQKLATAKVPAIIREAFAQKFPAASRAKWELETANMYEVNFRQAKEAFSAKFDQNGNLLETETEIKASGLHAFAKMFAGGFPIALGQVSQPNEVVDVGPVHARLARGLEVVVR